MKCNLRRVLVVHIQKMNDLAIRHGFISMKVLGYLQSPTGHSVTALDLATGNEPVSPQTSRFKILKSVEYRIFMGRLCGQLGKMAQTVFSF